MLALNTKLNVNIEMIAYIYSVGVMLVFRMCVYPICSFVVVKLQ